ncbi:phospholipase [Elizabethkingia argentiflava]|uniref:Phospholipase n=1 Tax=Elizabethkingia argenteiflava TaxID=2681556 RepID=A0A845PT67_9FLAO|nr:alpha/beta fold hydrolase [Elizabethkingia argenteiflava]NAW51439.1 phospholipase [Elizabethkingia argenteiflava]
MKKPANISPQTQVLVMLHGYGSNEEDLFNFTPNLPEDWFVISLRAPKPTPYGGFSWFDIDLSGRDQFVDKNEAIESVKGILDFIHNIKQEYQLTTRTHIMGFSQGGILAYCIALSYPHLFDKIAILNAYPEPRILENISKDKRALSEMRFFISHGKEDAIIPLDMARKAADTLYDLGCYFSFREYNSGHHINPQNYMDLIEFLS